ncbi:MAG: tetratricopeptide repeat protein [Holophaga sp.]|nr:tetratricopeptide repeat protein [Holophaga sp.]
MPSYLNILATSILIVGSAAPALADPTKDFATAITPVLQQKNTSEAEKLFLKDSPSSGRNQLLYLYELAGIYHLAGDFAKSAALLDQADAVARENEGKALASVTGGAAQFGAALTNDTVLLAEPPSEFQAVQFALPVGTNELNLAANDWAEKVLVKVVPGATTFVTVRSVPGFKTIFATTAGVLDTITPL